ncbi:hypothetical protein B296_00012956, partial [Ensete ventricosum]
DYWGRAEGGKRENRRRRGDEVRMSRSMGIPVKPLHETARPVVRVELTSGLLYRGNMIECEDIWNCRLGNIICAAKVLFFNSATPLDHLFPSLVLIYSLFLSYMITSLREKDQLLELAVVMLSLCVLGFV